MKPIRVYINVAVMGNVNDVLDKLLSNCVTSGLYDACERMFLIVNGDVNQLNIELPGDKCIILNPRHDVSRWEFPTLDLLWEDSKNNDFYVLYMHTKGVSHLGKWTFENVRDWVEYLTYFNVNQWRDRYDELEFGHSATGVNLIGSPDNIKVHPSLWNRGKPPMHYSGNFWWSSASHVRLLPKVSEWIPEGLINQSNSTYDFHMKAEMWLCQYSGKYHNAWSSNVDHYTNSYGEKMYKKNLLFAVPTLNRYENVVKLLAAIENGTSKPDQYLVIDNGKKFQETVQKNGWKLPDDCEIYVPGENIGVAAAWNVALRRGYDYTVIGSDDCVPAPNVIEILLNCAAKTGPGLYSPAFGENCSPWVFFLQTKTLTDIVGFYDERFWPGYFEDNDYFLRMKKKGFSPMTAKTAQAQHLDGGGCTVNQFKSHTVWKNQKRYEEKWGGPVGSETIEDPPVHSRSTLNLDPKVTILLPHLSQVDGQILEHRQAGLQRCLDSIEKQTYPRELIRTIVIDGAATVPEKVALGLTNAEGEYIVFAANDMEFAPDAIEVAVEESIKHGKSLVAFNGGDILPDEGNICEHFLIKKSFISSLEGGQIFSTDFHHTGADNWLWAQAKSLGHAHRSDRAKMVHHHFSKTGSPLDAVYQRGWSKFEEDKKILQKKLKKMNKKLKIVVYTITKNEEKFIERYCESAKDADEIVIVDTGSTDGTVEIAKKCGAIVHQISVSPWRFDVARTASLALLSADADVCIAADADEVLEPGWREEIEKVWTNDATRLRYLYDWGSGVQFVCDKIHSRRGYLWRHPCHECLESDGRVKEIAVHTDKLIIRHLPDNSKSRGQYLDLLELGVKESPNDVRHSFYYARELVFHKKNEAAIAELQRYLSLPNSTWADERAYAARLIGDCMAELERFDDAIEWYEKGAAIAPYRREPWLALAEVCYKQKRWQRCYEASKICLNTPKSSQWPVDARVDGFYPYDYAAISAYWLGKPIEAIMFGEKAVEMNPNDQRLIDNLKWYKGEA